MSTDRTVSFESEGETCRADLRLPDGSSAPDRPPIVVMGNGFGGTREMLLPRFAERFRDAGIATLAFDYRGFGDSTGPAQRIDPFAHLADWSAAIERARDIDAVDGTSLGLWGTSFAGGHVVETAADHDVDAVVAQAPFLDGIATLRHLFARTRPGYLPRAVGHALWDLGGSVLGRPPHRVPIVAPADAFGLLNVSGAFEGYRNLIDAENDWTNACDARVGLAIPRYRPLGRADAVDAPTLVVIADQDGIVPPASAERLVERLSNGTAIHVDGGHFEVYDGDRFEHSVAAQQSFFEDHLGV